MRRYYKILIASSITLSARSNLFVGDFFSIYNYIESIAKDREILFFNIDNNFGKKIIDLNRDIETRYKPNNNTEFNNYKDTNILVSQQGNIFYIKYPLFFDLDKQEKWGYLIYGFSINKIKSIIKKLDAIFIALLISLLLITCILVFIARKFFAQTLYLLINNFEQLIVSQSPEKGSKLLKEYTPIVNKILNLKTAITKYQQELQEKSRYEAVAKMSAELAHDVKNPLNVIKSQVDKLVICEEIKKDDAISARDIVIEQIKKITGLIKGIMDSTKPIRVNLANDNINRILSDYVGTITKYLDKNIVEINMNLDNKIPETQLDRTEIMRVFDNLIKNSQEATRNTKININIKTILKDNRINMTFTDDGTGIPKEKLSSIFDPYFTTKKTGDGIGLSTVYRIVKAHSGSINVESEVGKGTMFCINLPKS